MEEKFKSKVSITAELEIAPDIFQKINGDCELVWELSVDIRKDHINGIYIRVDEQNVDMICSQDAIHPKTGMEIELDGKEFKVKLSEITIDSTKFKFGAVIQPKDVLVFRSGTTVSFTGDEYD